MQTNRTLTPQFAIRPWLAVATLAVCSLAGCAGGQAGGATSAGPQGDVVMPDMRLQGAGNLRYTVEAGRTSHELDGTAGEAWPHLLTAYRAVGLEPDLVDQAGLTLGVGGVTVSRRLGDVRLSRLLSCGQTMTGPMADDARVTLHVESRLEPAGPNTVILRTRLGASAVPNEAAAGGSRDCASLHVIESRIAEAVQEALASGS
ncbi:MAG: hypothetical protein ACR2QM_18395 [Longimicrobiales bacterium]